MEVFLSYLEEVLESVVIKRAIKKANVKFTDVLPLEEKQDGSKKKSITQIL